MGTTDQLPQTILSVTCGQAAFTSCALFFLYSTVIFIYRPFFHPLRKVPGPRLAPLIQWVETY
ncbi:hypothetical protein K469DRAFT_776291 [Zopfia rhizophila CBS 207.26]|uniref:Cytochrome P450 n=1 Tax=Zopfia rhizophila CBS 207.26 TaxID=1314779 RepID=A0A6A6E2V8_9PEZI|nr:hypothetical protein K469DRAFT_776291 [Zopfia rhizophila CBS 207.26]